MLRIFQRLFGAADYLVLLEMRGKKHNRENIMMKGETPEKNEKSVSNDVQISWFLGGLYFKESPNSYNHRKN